MGRYNSPKRLDDLGLLCVGGFPSFVDEACSINRLLKPRGGVVAYVGTARGGGHALQQGVPSHEIRLFDGDVPARVCYVVRPFVDTLRF